MRTLILYITGLIILWATGCEDPNKNVTFKVYDKEPISAWLSERPEFSEWVKMLKRVNIFNSLNLRTEYTCFVADNEAVAAYLKEHTDYKSADEMPDEEVDYLLRYHILPGKILTGNDLLLKLSIPTASGFYLTAGVDPITGNRYIDNGAGRERSVLIQRDIRLTNGVVHKLDRMLQPITESVWDLVNETSRYGIFRQAIAECGLQEWLSTREKALTEDYTYLDEKAILMVSDSIFAENGITDLAGLKTLYPGEGSDTTSAFYRYVTYHILNSVVGYAEITDFPPDVKSMNIYPYASMSAITVVDSSNKIYLNPHTGNPVNFIDSKRDIPANNGYIHEIDGLLPIPEFLVRHTIVYEVTGRPEFKIIPFYRSEKGTNDAPETFVIEPGLIPGIRWESIPASKAKVYYQSQNIDEGRFWHYDALVAELGGIGWIELDLPVLPKGKYEVQAVKSVTKGGGKYTVWLDQVALGDGAERDFGGGDKTPRWGICDFTREEAHTIRFKVASVAGFWMIDRLMFVPVD